MADAHPWHADHTGHRHAVQFYEDERFLSSAVADFLAGGLSAGQPLIVIATEPRRASFAAGLTSRGFDPAEASRSGNLTLLDAREMLGAFMSGAVPDPDRFRTAIGGVIDQRSRHGDVSLRLYGEMVDLLWAEGNTDGALRLEELWNELADKHDFSLLCAYALGNFYREEHAPQFQEICRQHSHVIPTERYVQGDTHERQLEVSRLQQRARALESEIEHRKELERRLRETLAARSAAEEALRRSERDLQQSLELRERLLDRERAARAEAEAASAAKTEFLAVMSHELRTPLNAIGGHTQLIQLGVYGPVTDAQQDALARVQRSQRHLLALINDLLNLARIEAGRVEYQLENVQVDAMLADVCMMVAPLLSAKQLTCVAVPESNRNGHGPSVVRADREKTQQILLNLLTNAIKFTPEGGRITLDVASCADAPTMACVRVTDTGIGIPATKLESIFEPFVQLASRRTDQPQGVGLGLAISRDLARGMGGSLAASSTPGAGSTFTLQLPLA